MKKLIMMFSLVLSVVLCSQQAQALKIIGVEIQIQKGTKEWNADKTDAVCIGKGLCVIIIKGNVGLNENEIAGTLGFDENGRFGIVVPADIIRSSKWSDTFVDGTVSINKDINLGRDIRDKLSNCPSTIPAGKYRYTLESGSAFIFFN